LRIKRKDAETYIEPKVKSETKVYVEKMEVSPEMRVWRKTKRKPDCKSKDPEACLTWQAERIAAKYVDVRKEAPATILPEQGNNVIVTPEDYVIILQQTIIKEAEVREVDVFPEYREVTRYVKKEAERFEEVKVAPEYQSVRRIRLMSEGGKIEPREVVCPKDYPRYVTQVQQKLLYQGYEVGEVNGLLSKKTKEAILKYQVDNALPIGQLDFATLNRLGIAK
jgi:hypothetical protein